MHDYNSKTILNGVLTARCTGKAFEALMKFFEVEGEYEKEFEDNGLSNMELRKP